MFPYGQLAKYAFKQSAKKFALNTLDSNGINTTNPREDYAIEKYNDPYSPIYQNAELVKEYYNPILPIDKDPQEWNAEDLINATNSPLYKYDQQLQNKAHDYIQYRTKRRLNGLF